MIDMGLLKWVACWGNATSITDRREAVYAKNLTLRYPVRMPFTGSALRRSKYCCKNLFHFFLHKICVLKFFFFIRTSIKLLTRFPGLRFRSGPPFRRSGCATLPIGGRIPLLKEKGHLPSPQAAVEKPSL